MIAAPTLREKAHLGYIGGKFPAPDFVYMEKQALDVPGSPSFAVVAPSRADDE